jgi:hypothetical protein
MLPRAAQIRVPPAQTSTPPQEPIKNGPVNAIKEERSMWTYPQEEILKSTLTASLIPAEQTAEQRHEVAVQCIPEA